ncbi:hypothetical protein A6X21_04160 [Planctopirus hydrillae]|uniref:Uncharacterized protein n=1 Tax=Planctopirus hydrillae TaxID=1841610 RepID=A0A1C3ENM2_9PLAN|nr:hypothetical protein A6X21_04160 [Planctopirus hydrillae]
MGGHSINNGTSKSEDRSHKIQTEAKAKTLEPVASMRAVAAKGSSIRCKTNMNTSSCCEESIQVSSTCSM